MYDLVEETCVLLENNEEIAEQCLNIKGR